MVETATLHALGWLAAANAVGLLLALLLALPALGTALGPLGYGRWMPLHLDLELYGWCSLPLVAVLLRSYLPRRVEPRWPALALAGWSGALAFGAVSWLAGRSSGKDFLDFAGSARAVLALAMVGLALVLGGGLVQRARSDAAGAEPPDSGRARAGKAALLVALAGVPFLLYWAASPGVHPPINPETSGPTGTSLLGSTLGVIALIGGVPLLAGVRPRSSPLAARSALAALVVHTLIFLALDHGDHSHREIVQRIAVWSLVPWLALLDWHLRSLEWPRGATRWLDAFRAWWLLLVSSAALMFLPGLLDHVKFTNVLVGHAHVAMAGAVTSFVVLLLAVVLRDTRLADLFRDRLAFVAWHGGNAAMAALLAALGALEAGSRGVLFRPSPLVEALYLGRALAGAAMLYAALRWLAAGLAAVGRDHHAAATASAPGLAASTSSSPARTGARALPRALATDPEGA